jgi:hypothetical protein
VKITHITIAVNGDVSVKRADMYVDKRSVLNYLGITELREMDAYTVHQNPDGTAIVVEHAQKEPWTWVKHIIFYV